MERSRRKRKEDGQYEVIEREGYVLFGVNDEGKYRGIYGCEEMG